MKKFILVFCLLLFSAQAYAKSAPFNLSHLAYSVPKDFVRVADDENLPASFDLRDFNAVARDVRSQGNWGTCWAFGFLAAVESSYLTQVSNDIGKYIGDLGNANTTDLSELHLAYFVSHGLAEKQNFSVIDKKTDKLAKTPTMAQSLNNGGYNITSVAALTRGYGWGPVSELNYDELYYTKYADVSDDVVDKLALNIKSLDQYSTALRITDASYLVAVDRENARLMFSTEENRNIIKKFIMKNGAVAVAYNAASNMFLNQNTGAYFYSENDISDDDEDKPANQTNHVVSIIGWDDDFSVDNFNSKDVTRPEHNGAWLVRNSWGDWANDGYFWISYEQYMLEGTAFIVESADKTLRTYGYDDLGWTSSWGNGEKTAKAANIFRAKSYETLEGAGFYTTDNNATVSVKIYNYGKTHPNHSDDPTASINIESGSPTVSKTATYELAGYHTMKFDTFPSIKSGDYFGVVAEFSNASYDLPVAVEQRINGYSDFALAFDGESYFWDGSKWFNGASNTEASGDMTLHMPSNACIKAFTKCNDGKVYFIEDDSGKSIDGIGVKNMPELTVSETAIEDNNPIENEDSYKGRVISQIAVDNDGEPLAEGISLDVDLVYIQEFEEYTPHSVSKNGLLEISQELDPMYPADYVPSFYMQDGFIYPVYATSLITKKGGSITIDADNLIGNYGKKIKVPAGYYDVIYTRPDDEIIGALRVIEITEANEKEADDEDDDAEKEKSVTVNSSNSGCNSGLTMLGLGLVSMAIMRKKVLN